jgi:LiaI-LiaF-like transmembrane region
MSDRIRCACPRCTIRGVMGPAILVTLGVLFLLDQMRGGFFNFSNTWPMILIVIGFISLGSSLAPMTGHVSPVAPQVPGTYPIPPGAPQAAAPTAPPQSTPPAEYPGQGQ